MRGFRRAEIRRRRDVILDAAGTTAIEFAIVAPLLLGVALATLQAASILLVEAFFESAAEQAARIVLTNQTSSLTAAQFESQSLRYVLSSRRCLTARN